MARRFLALLLMGTSWFRVARFDVLEDPDSVERFKLQSFHPARLLDHAQTARPTEKLIDSASHTSPAQLVIGSRTLWQHISKLHSAVPLTKSISGQIARSALGSGRFLNAHSEGPRLNRIV